MKIHALRRVLAMGLASAVGVLAAGCSAIERPEDHSVVIRKPAHRYHSYSDADLGAMAIIHEASESSSAPEKKPLSGSELIRSEPQLGGPLEPFCPFRYCYLHQTYHESESTIAVATAPIQYPLAAGTTLTVVIVKSTIVAAQGFWDLIFPTPTPAAEPERPPQRSPER